MKPIDLIFRELTPQARRNHLINYNQVIHHENNPTPRHIPMPWMLQHWEKGKQELIRVMGELGEKTNYDIPRKMPE